MSRLVLDLSVPGPQYDRQTMTEIIRALCNQLNSLSEGRISARYQAQTSVPGASFAAAVSDIVWDSNATVRNGTVGGAGGTVMNYVRLGWVCNVGDLVNPTWQELRIPVG